MDQPLAREIQKRGPQITNSLAAAKAFLSRLIDQDIDERQVAGALLFMVLTPTRQRYSVTVFVSAVHDLVDRSFDWHLVLQGLDFQAFEISKEQFLALFQALLPIAQGNRDFDIQALWGGQWRNPETQLSFVKAFLALSPSELDVTSIPGLRTAYDPHELLDGPDDVAKYAEKAMRDTMISLDAVSVLIDNIVSEADEAFVMDIISGKEALFLWSCFGNTPPTPGQEFITKRLFATILTSNQPDGDITFHILWIQDKNSVASILCDMHHKDPLLLTIILDKARQYGWLDDLYTLTNGLGIDVAALAHRNGELDFERWVEDKPDQDTGKLASSICKFLQLKLDDELRTCRGEQPVPGTVSLSIKTVYDMLAVVDQHMSDRIEVKRIQRQCYQAFPRLIIYCEDIGGDVDVNCKRSNGLPAAADEEMQDLYKRMYNSELHVKDILDLLRDCRDSKDLAKLDVFACMIHGLFDEFSCFGEYPLAPLATTAVLFGGIIAHGLISDLTLRVGQEMVLEAVHDHPPEASMYKFGLQALIQFPNRLREPEWFEYCSLLIQIPGLRGTEPYRIAVESFSENRSLRIGDPSNGLVDGMELPNGDLDEYPPDTTISFKSVTAEPTSAYDEPDEDVQEKVVFFFNNVSEQNLKSKLGQLQGVLEDRYHQWFAFFLVEGRAKVEPNYQPLYLSILESLGNTNVWKEVLRETFVSVQKSLNAEATMQSAAERKKLKNLASWLGSLTIARDKPIKHKNFSFVDFLIEGLETQRLLLAIPFTCSVLVKGADSVVFKPPNPWILEIVSVLIELYEHFDITTNQKFDIEKLLVAFNVDFDTVEPSETIRTRPLLNDDLSNPLLPNGLDSFEEMNLGNIARTARNPRFDTDAMSAALPDLGSILRFPPATGSTATQVRLQEMVVDAIRRAIIEIIAPVVERSVTIATIATSALIHKDFATEPDDDRVRRSAQQMVRQLSGSLALVTCKEPLKMSMTNCIRMAQQDMAETFPEGVILMCVNDNLDIACTIVEKQAEDRSMPEIESHIENEINQRRQHRTDHPNEPYVDPAFNRWSGFIPDPYKLSSIGLNQEQLAIYLDFARQSRAAPTHAQTGSADSGRQLPDVLAEAFAAGPIPNTPAAPLAIPHQPSTHAPGRMLPPPALATMSQIQANGYATHSVLQDRVQVLLTDVGRMARDKSDRSLIDIQPEDPLSAAADQALDLMISSPDTIAMDYAEGICKALYGEPMSSLEMEIKIQLLQRLCASFTSIRKEVAIWASAQDVQKLFNTDVTVALIKADILQMKQIDSMLTSLIYDHVDFALDFMSALLDGLLLNDRPTALRADFVGSLSALGSWLAEDADLEAVQDLVEKLRHWGINDVDVKPDEQNLRFRRQIKYALEEWASLSTGYPKSPNEQLYSSFVSQLYRQRLIDSKEGMMFFLRICIEEAIEFFASANIDEDGSSNEGFLRFDCLARLIIFLVLHQVEASESVGRSKAEHMDSILSTIVLIMNHQQIKQGERFNQRAFFRLLSSILCDWHGFGRGSYIEDRDMLIVFADLFLGIGPRYFPGFTYSWLALISHRIFMPGLLKLANNEVSPSSLIAIDFADPVKGCDSYVGIMEIALSYVGELLKHSSITPLAKDLYRGVLRIVLVLHHDFPEFLVENHFRLCNAIPHHCTQLHNLILSAYPSSFLELPNPYVMGLKLDRLQEAKHSPRISPDFSTPLKVYNIKEFLDASFKTNDNLDDTVSRVVRAARVTDGQGSKVNVSLLHALVLYIGQGAIATAGQRGGQTFTGDSPPAVFMTKLSKELDPEACYYFLSSVAHQLRYPNSHTHYFAYALLHIYGMNRTDQEDLNTCDQICRILLERLHVIKPHPWGLVIIMLELLKNPDYALLQLPFFKTQPEVNFLLKCLKFLLIGYHRFVRCVTI